MSLFRIETNQLDFHSGSITTLPTSITFFQPCQPLNAGKAGKEDSFSNLNSIFNNAR